MKNKNIFDNLLTTISHLHYFPSNSSFEDADFVILGIPFDRSSSFRSGSKNAPNAIREASHNFEGYNLENDFDFSNSQICDLGDIEELGSSKEMLESIKEVCKLIIDKEKFPIIMGGEHFMTSTVASCYEDIGVITLDAHLDFRETYMGDKFSHACGTKRTFDVLGKDNIAVIGVRSMSEQEKKDADNNGLNYFSCFDVNNTGIEGIMKKAIEGIKNDNIYLSLDMDVIDPSFAPAVGNPEPFGLSSLDVKKSINILGKKLVGFEITEVSPIYDNGNTSTLAAKFIREVIVSKSIF